jgi:hypothetical protein
LLELFKARRKSEILKSTKSEAELREGLHSYRFKLIVSFFNIFLVPILAVLVFLTFPITQLVLPLYFLLSLLLSLPFVIYLVRKFVELSIYQEILSESKNIYQAFHQLNGTSNQKPYKELLHRLRFTLQGELCVYLRLRYRTYLDDLTAQLKDLDHREKLSELKRRSQKLQLINEQKITDRLNSQPLMRIKQRLESALKVMEAKRDEWQKQWETAYKGFSWWNKITKDCPGLESLKKRVSELETLNGKFKQKHEGDISELLKEHKKALLRSNSRINDSYETAAKVFQKKPDTPYSPDDLLQKAFLTSAFVATASIVDDFSRTGDIYDSLRKVNQNFQGMGDTEIWWETLWMSDDSLEGLSSLTKGAYFEDLVADDTGGQLFEHFNHPDTDILIDGVEVQLKATDSISYIESVDSAIPVIATSEVAETTDAIDSGFSNAELSDSVDLALGGTVIDVADTVTDSILAGLGGLGLFATIRGINHTVKKYHGGGDGAEAIFEGAEIAIVGTAKGMVDTSELVYKAVTSKPVRFVSRLGYSGLKKLGKRLSKS